MKRDFAAPLRDLEGNPLLAAPERILTLGEACATALMNTYQEDATVPTEEKMQRYHLASRIYKKQLVEVYSEEISLIKKYVAKLYGPVVMGPVFLALEDEGDTPSKGG